MRSFAAIALMLAAAGSVPPAPPMESPNRGTRTGPKDGSRGPNAMKPAENVTVPAKTARRRQRQRAWAGKAGL